MTQLTLKVDGLANVRDLGGLTRIDGSLTPHGVFIRAEALDRVTDAGWRELHRLGVATVIDLRRPEERNDRVPSGVDLIAVDLDGDAPEFWQQYEADGRWGTPLYYLPHLAEVPQFMADVVEAIASARDGAVLFHCGAGWDRTGFVAALLLRALGVEPSDATRDYLASFENAQAMEELHAKSSDVVERLGVLARFEHTPESAFVQAYNGIDLEGWFDHAGIDQRTRSAIATWRGAVRS